MNMVHKLLSCTGLFLSQNTFGHKHSGCGILSSFLCSLLSVLLFKRMVQLSVLHTRPVY